MRKLTKVLFEIAAVLFACALGIFLLGGLGEYFFDKVWNLNISSAASAGVASILLIAAIVAVLVSFAVMIKGEKSGRRRHHPVPH